jgi:hypothetical protein
MLPHVSNLCCCFRVQVVDSRCGEHWSVYSQQATSTASDQNAAHQQEAGLQPLYDACSSWWTQVGWSAVI